MADFARTSLADMPIVPHRAPNLAPEGTYRLPAADLDLADDMRKLLRVHPLSYSIGGQWFARCPTCEEWTGHGGCEVRRLAERDAEAAKALHEEREWPAGTGYATTRYCADGCRRSQPPATNDATA